MQCPSCRAVYSNGLDLCPRCKTPAAKAVADPQPKQNRPQPETQASMAANAHRREAASSNPAPEATASGTPQTQAASTLIEFPGMAQRPQWRKELSERVREIQERRARDAEREAQELARRKLDQPPPPPQATAMASSAGANGEPSMPQLGLVPQPDAPAVNPIVAAALKRIERARQPPSMPSRARMGSGGAATAVARVAEEQFEDEAQLQNLILPAPLPAPAPLPVQDTRAEAATEKTPERTPERTSEPLREHTLVVVQSPPPSLPKQVQETETVRKTETVKKTEVIVQPQPKLVFAEAVDDTFANRLEATAPLPFEEPYDDHAPVFKRLAGALIDLMVVAFASTPFAAIIELTNGNWTDIRVASSMGGIILLVMFLYLSASTALTGRTWGMSLVSLRAVDAATGNGPTTWQAVGRALLYMLSLATLCLGILYALFDAEGRTAHDHFSGTAVVRE